MAKLRLNDEIISTAEKLISAGNYTNVICDYLGINETTWYRWFNTGEAHAKEGKDTMQCKFYKSIKKAEAAAEMRSVAIIQGAAKNTWQAAAWFLERKHRDRWGREPVKDDNTDGNIDRLIEVIARGAK